MCARTVYCTNIDKKVVPFVLFGSIKFYIPADTFLTASLFW